MFGHDLYGAAMTVVENGVPRQIIKQGTMPEALRPAGPQAAACRSVVTSGADYLCATYEMGIRKAEWKAGAYPLDHVGQHLYLDQGGNTTREQHSTFLLDLRKAYLLFEGPRTSKQTHITEFGWTTAYVSEQVQATNLKVAYDTYEETSYVGRAYWFSVQDVPEGAIYYGLVDEDWVQKAAFTAYQANAR
jgi:hypothetical protein